MHTPLRSRLPRFVAIGAVMALCAHWWLNDPADAPVSPATQREHALADASEHALRPVSPFGATPALAPEEAGPEAAAPAADAPAAPPANAPPGMTPEQWARLQAALKDHPDRDAELQRVARYMAFKDTFERFETARAANADTAQLRTLARDVDAGLDERLANAEMSAGEARVVKAAVLEVLEADPVRRVEQIQQWARRQPRPAAGADPHDTQREARYKEQEAAIVADWQALPPQQRDPHQLEAQLDALRQRTFNTE